MSYILDTDTTIPMRDGTRASAAVWRHASGAAPVLLMRTPYGVHEPAGPLTGGGADYTPYVMSFLEAGYAVVWIECRGTYRSEGVFTPVVDEKDDALAALEWLTAQPWCDGRVGMYGFSYVGMTQWAAASTGHPALRAVAPSATTMNWHSGCWYSSGGLLNHGVIAYWHNFMFLAEEARKGADSDPEFVDQLLRSALAEDELIRTRSIAENPLLARRWLPGYLEHPDYGPFWHDQDFTRVVDRMSTPALVVGGWFDLFINTQVKDWMRLRRDGASVGAREDSRLIIGPWGHEYSIGQYPETSFGPIGNMALAGLTEEHITFFDQHVKGEAPDSEPSPVRIFVMGSNEWRDLPDFPVPGAREVEYFLTPRGLAPNVGESWSETFAFDPQDPVPTAGGALLPTTYGLVGPVDQHAIAERPDVVSFVSAELEGDLDVIGFVTARLFVSSSARDTDFTAKLIDVHPDGRALSVCDGALRMRYRDDLSNPVLVEPGRIYEIEIDMAVTAITLLRGHRIRLDVSSSNFPHHDVNSNTGGPIAKEGPADWVIAHNTIHGGTAAPSRLILPVVDRA